MMFEGTLPGRNPGSRACFEYPFATRSISAATMSLGISIVIFFCVSLTSWNSLFMGGECERRDSNPHTLSGTRS